MMNAMARIGDTCQVGDGTHSTISRQDSGVMYITSRNLKDGRLDVSKLYFISEHDYAKHFLGNGKALTRPEKGDLVFSIIGSMGEPYLIRERDRFGISSSVAIVRPDRTKLASEFLLYWMKGTAFQSAFHGIRGGVAQGYVSLEMLRSLPVPILDLKLQRRIADALSAYDELIENNQRRIRILEEMARSLYREWFVHFRFPGHENHPRVPSTLGEIPKGWEISSLGEVTTKIGSGATPRGGKDAYKQSGINLIRSLNVYDYDFVMDDLAFIDEQQASQLDNVQVQPHDVLLNITGASVARCAMVPSSLLPARVNQHVAIIRANKKKADPFFLLDTINNDFNKRQLLGIAQGGATREALTKIGLEEFKIVLPPLKLIYEYGHYAGALHRQREYLSSQNQVLRETRDLLLPRLLSGQTKLEIN